MFEQEPFLCLRRGVSLLSDKTGVCLTFLCLRRGVSGGNKNIDFFAHFSLPTQRCFSIISALSDGRTLFSAYAEVFRSCAASLRICSAFLCLRRGVSQSKRQEKRER